MVGVIPRQREQATEYFLFFFSLRRCRQGICEPNLRDGTLSVIRKHCSSRGMNLSVYGSSHSVRLTNTTDTPVTTCLSVTSRLERWNRLPSIIYRKHSEKPLT